MKKVIALVAAAAFVLSMASMASAAHEGRHQLQTSGMLQMDLTYTNNESFSDEKGEKESQTEAHTRLRQYFEYIASENLKATVGYEIDAVWGNSKAPGGADSGDGSNSALAVDTDDFLELKRLNMEFTLPGTETTSKVGIQWVELPSLALGSNLVLNGDMPGVTVSTPVTDTANLTFGWLRKYDSVTTSSSSPGYDAFFAAMPIEQDGFSFDPFAVYSLVGKDAWNGDYTTTTNGTSVEVTRDTNDLEDTATMYHVGTGLQVDTLDPIGMRAGFVYGSLSADNDENDKAGWLADLAVNYKMEAMTPEVFGMYTSGDDDDADDGSERLPTIYNDGLYAVYPSMLFGDPTYLGIGGDGAAGTAALGFTPQGIWAAGATLKSITLTDKLTGTLTAQYVQGTDDEDAVNKDILGDSTLTAEDSAFEVDFAANYKIYEQLSAIMEVGYAKFDYDEKVGTRDNDYKDDPATRIGVGLLYSF